MNFFVIHLGYTSEKLPKKKILEVRELSATEAQDLGAPSGKEWDSLFGAGATKVYGIHFEAVKPEETPTNIRKVKKSTEAFQSIKAGSAKPKVMEVEEVLEGVYMDKLFQPKESREVKNKKEEEEAKQREIHVPNNLLRKFKETAWPHSPKEYMAWITGTIEQDKKSKKSFCYADGLFFPKQSGSDWQCMEEDSSSSEKLIQHLEERQCQIVGWMHFHPTFEAFFSSIDQHMQYSLQKDNPVCFGLVMDKDAQVRCLRLSAEGMEAVSKCENHNQAMFL
jgi:proteasome lid subunit RPN8/RPN11